MVHQRFKRIMERALAVLMIALGAIPKPARVAAPILSVEALAYFDTGGALRDLCGDPLVAVSQECLLCREANSFA